MDTSKEYIEMCRKAVEIQELAPQSFENRVGYPPDMFYNIATTIRCSKCHTQYYPDDVYCSLHGDGCFEEIERTFWTYDKQCIEEADESIWLPRQDQLQEMLGGNDWADQMKDIWNFVNKKISGCFLHNKTWNQIWLSYFMYVKFGKLWNGENWK